MDYTEKFEEFWSHYPKKKAKVAAFNRWQQHDCESKADMLIGHIKKRARHDPQFLGSQRMIPNCDTFINQRRWEDEYATVEEEYNRQEQSDAAKSSRSALEFPEVRRAVKMAVLRHYTDETILNAFAISPMELAEYRKRLKGFPSVWAQGDLEDFEKELFGERPATELTEGIPIH